MSAPAADIPNHHATALAADTPSHNATGTPPERIPSTESHRLRRRARHAEASARYSVFLLRRDVAVSALLLIMALQLALLVLSSIRTAWDPVFLAVFLTDDLLVLVGASAALYFVVKYATPKAIGEHLNTVVSPPSYLLRALQAQPLESPNVPTPPPWVVHSGTFELVVLGVMFLSATRLAVSDLVFCTGPGSQTTDYRPCKTYAIGAFPFPIMGMNIVICAMVMGLLVERIERAMVALTLAYAFTFSVWMTLANTNSDVTLSGFDVTWVTILTAVGYASTA